MKPEGSILSLIADILRHSSGLIEKEIQLAKAEIGENITRAGLAVGLLLGATILAVVALNLVAGTLVAALIAAGLSVVWAPLIVAGGFAIIALVMVLKAQADLKKATRAPSRAAESIRRDAKAFKEAAYDK